MSASPAIEALDDPAELPQLAHGAQFPAELLDELARRTSAHRELRRTHHRHRAMGAALKGQRTTAQWHEQRARGQRRRFRNIATCGERYQVARACGECGTVSAQPVGCGVLLACPRCRGQAARRRRHKTRRAIEAVTRSHRWLMRPRGAGGRWGWRFITLTIPHEQGIARDLREAVRELWPRFVRQLAAHLERDRGERSEHRVTFIRALETTAEGEYGGHAHLHVLVFSPFLDHVMLRLWWGRALERTGRAVPRAGVADVLAGRVNVGALPMTERRAEQLRPWLVTRRGAAGRPLDSIPWPVCDVRAAGEEPENELVKYLVKDVTASGERASAATLADLYCALDGLRTFGGSRGLWTLADVLDLLIHGAPPCICGDCDRETEYTYTIESLDAVRGPPTEEGEECESSSPLPCSR
jgi:hypothetical protein